MTFYFDGLCCEQGGGMGIVLITHQGISIPFSFKLSFECKNKNPKYETLIIRNPQVPKWDLSRIRETQA